MAEAAVSRILLSRLPGTAAIRLGQLLPAASSGQPVPPFREEKRRAVLKAEPIRPCTGRGLPSPAGHPAGWWALTPPFHPYRARRAAVYFLWPFPWGRPRSPLATSLPYGVRTFLWLKSQRPPGILRRCRLMIRKLSSPPLDGLVGQLVGKAVLLPVNVDYL